MENYYAKFSKSQNLKKPDSQYIFKILQFKAALVLSRTEKILNRTE